MILTSYYEYYCEPTSKQSLFSLGLLRLYAPHNYKKVLTEKELLASIWAMEKLEMYLLGRKFTPKLAVIFIKSSKILKIQLIKIRKDLNNEDV